jgi:hypothetical protein
LQRTSSFSTKTLHCHRRRHLAFEQQDASDGSYVLGRAENASLGMQWNAKET